MARIREHRNKSNYHLRNKIANNNIVLISNIYFSTTIVSTRFSIIKLKLNNRKLNKLSQIDCIRCRSRIFTVRSVKIVNPWIENKNSWRVNEEIIERVMEEFPDRYSFRILQNRKTNVKEESEETFIRIFSLPRRLLRYQRTFNSIPRKRSSIAKVSSQINWKRYSNKFNKAGRDTRCELSERS